MEVHVEDVYYRVITLKKILSAVVFLFVFDFTCRLIYRVLLSPIRSIPGPILAATSSWYQIHWNVWRGGQMIFHIEDLHKKYGPIIRIGPDEVHINDCEFHSVIYSNEPFSKYYPHIAWLDAPLGSFTTVDHATHRQRRNALNQVFSRQAIFRFSEEIRTRVTKICDRLNHEFRGTNKPVQIELVAGCLSSDVIMQYAFGRSYDFIECENFNSVFVKALKDMLAGVHLLVNFNWFIPLTRFGWLASKVSPELKSVFKWKSDVMYHAKTVVAAKDQGNDNISYPTVFRALLNSNLPAKEKTWQRLNDEALAVVGAGLETVKNVVKVAVCHLLLPENKQMLDRLKAEIEEAWPGVSVHLSLPQLEKLPYLTAVLWESLRLSYGASSRLTRYSATPLQYKSYTLPPGTVFSMSSYSLHHNETIYPDSHSFKPERWLADPTTGVLPTGPDGKRPLTQYMASFSRGARSCVGINLAWAELYLFTAELFRKVEMEIFETTAADVKMLRDQWVMGAYDGSQGVRVTIK